VIWQGPDIPCINLCAGDSIDEVVFKLATLLCDVTENVLDVTTLEFATLVAPGQSNPTTILQTLQLIINTVVYMDQNGTTGSTGRPSNTTSIVDPLVSLPECLYFERDGDLVTSLPVTEYAAYLATYICTLLTELTSTNSSLSNITTRILSVETSVQNILDNTYEIYVTSQCASAPTEGTSILIQDAFSNLESSFCTLLGTTGISTLLIAAINRQCPSLGTTPQLSDPLNTMNALTGWVNTPTTIADTISNLWLTMCDMRNSLAVYFAIPVVPPCVLAVPENLTVTTIGTTNSTVTWNAPSYTGIEEPMGYRIEVFEWTGSAPTGPSVYDVMLSPSILTQNIPSSSLTLGQDYVVYVHVVNLMVQE
jgi:hypothetical protein